MNLGGKRRKKKMNLNLNLINWKQKKIIWNFTGLLLACLDEIDWATKCIHSAVLVHGHVGQLSGGPTCIRPHANLCMLCMACFLMLLNTDFVGNTNIINMFDLIEN